jgi:hypothetical protein
VTLDDLAWLCGKYGKPPDGVVTIIDRGYGFQLVEYDEEA